MKAVMISIQPKWCELIASGEKTIEVRKTMPKLKPPFKCYIYCTKDKPYLYREANPPYDLFLDSDLYRGGDYETRFLSAKVIGEFVCDWIKEIEPHCDIDGQVNQYISHYPAIIGNSCLSFQEMKAYLGCRKGYDWHITDLKIYDKPKELRAFYTVCNKEDEQCCGCQYLEEWGGEVNCEDCGGSECLVSRRKPLSCPPESWQYVEEL